MTQCIAVDWSGRAKGAAETIWLALVRDGKLVELENGRDRDEVIAAAIAAAKEEPRTVVGLDFAFGLPAWYAHERGWATGRRVWEAMREEADDLLKACDPPFWGHTGTHALPPEHRHRATELAFPGLQPKSVFQIAGAGAVGTGSLRGMPFLLTLADAGFAVWPFDEPGWPLAIEIYPRVLTGPVVKSDPAARKAYLANHHPALAAPLRTLAASSEDAFDAAVSALAMHAHVRELEALGPVPCDSPVRIEGEIWRPGLGGG